MKHKIPVISLIAILFLSISLRAQQTMGLFLNSPDSYNGYTLFSSVTYPDVYLIDNCGDLVHSWHCENNQANSVYLLENGLLLRPEHIDNFLNVAGTGGLLRMYDKDGNVVWEYQFSTDSTVQHHDIHPMPNGNILLIAYEYKTFAECKQAGKDTTKLTSGGIWSEELAELKPIGSDSAEIVWEWHVWDHLIQDFDSTKDNYGVVSEHPELININYVGSVGEVDPRDWLHFNSVDYNARLDQVMVSMRHLSEIWIIDHGTSMQEAAAHSGGTLGHGGDLLFRWGNPAVYNRGTTENRQFWGQHSAHWIPDAYPDGGDIMVYNNGVWGPEYSTIDIIRPPIEQNNDYTIVPDSAYGPQTPFWTYGDADSNFFYSPMIAGANRMPNGNTLICVGVGGHFFEIDPAGNKVWDYVNPVGLSGPGTQGLTPGLNFTFRITRYAPDYPGLEGYDLTGGEPIELNPLPDNCQLYFTGEKEILPSVNQIIAGPNPFIDQINVSMNGLSGQVVSLYDMTGRLVWKRMAATDKLIIPSSGLHSGIYLLKAGTNSIKLIHN